MKYYEFQITEEINGYETISPVKFIEAETEEQAKEFADAYLRDFRGCEGIEKTESGYCTDGILVELVRFAEIPNMKDWMEKQIQRMRLQYDKAYINEVDIRQAKFKKEQEERYGVK